VLTSTERLRGGFRNLLSADTSAAAICPVSLLSRAMLTEFVGEAFQPELGSDDGGRTISFMFCSCNALFVGSVGSLG
jgi:hypothetical protein